MDAPAAKPSVAMPAGEGRHETILIVEDATALRALARRVLQRKGYQVLDAPDAAGALALAARPGPIDLLLSDVVMPEMDGPQLAARIREVRPQIRILFMSGYSEKPALRQALGPGTGFIQKPFTTAALVAQVRALLDTTPG